MNKKKLLKFSLKLFFSLALLLWVFFQVEWGKTWDYLRAVELWEVALYLFLVLVGMAISAHKWKILANHKNIHAPFFDFFKYYLTGTFVNNFMPSFIGGDAYRAYQVGRAEKKYAVAASTVVVDRITGLVGATILAVFFSLLNWRSVSTHGLLVVLNVALVGSFFLDFAIMRIRRLPILAKLAQKYLPEKIRHFFSELEEYGQDQWVLLKAVGWGGAFSLVGVALANYVLLRSLGVSLGVLDYLSVIFLITIVSSIPITINNIGLKEWAYVTFFGFFGVEGSLIIIAAILGRFLQMALSFTALPMYLRTKKEIVEKN